GGGRAGSVGEGEEAAGPAAAASFRLALERERHHRDMSRHAPPTFDGAPAASASAAAASSIAAPASASTAAAAPGSGRAPVTVSRAPAAAARTTGVTAAAMPRMDGRGHMSGLDTEAGRIERLPAIRQARVVARDALMS